METKIYSNIPENEKFTCKTCNKTLNSKKGLSLHLKNVHGIDIADYIGENYVEGGRPKCPKCGKNTKYNSKNQSFNMFCPEHSGEAKRIHGKLKGYGSEHNKGAGWRKGLTKETNESIRKHSESMKGKNNHFYGKKHSKETKQKLRELKTDSVIVSEEEFYKRKQLILDRFEILEDFSGFGGVHKELKVKCASCGDLSERTLWSLERFSICRKCTPQSTEELELKNFIVSLGVGVEENTRLIIPPRELDIYCADKKIAFEYNGLYWHTENKKGKDYHLQKLESCLEKDIQLVQVFSDTWNNKKEIVKSLIRNRLGLSEYKYDARKCSIKTLNKNQEKEFFNSTHVSGFSGSKIAFGLFYVGECVAAMSLRVPFNKKYRDTIEICRFSTKLNSNVRGALSKLLKTVKNWAIEQGYKEMLTYADRNFGEGNGYLKVGFEKIGQTKPDYFYTNGKERFGRMKFRAQKGLTERKYAELMKVERVYGCGSNIFLLNLPNPS